VLIKKALVRLGRKKSTGRRKKKTEEEGNLALEDSRKGSISTLDVTKTCKNSKRKKLVGLKRDEKKNSGEDIFDPIGMIAHGRGGTELGHVVEDSGIGRKVPTWGRFCEKRNVSIGITLQNYTRERLVITLCSHLALLGRVNILKRT